MKNDAQAGKAAVGKRLKQALAALGLPMTTLSEKSGLIYSSVQNYVAGKQMPGGEALTKIRESTGINADWILTGEGEMMSKTMEAQPRNFTIDDLRELRSRFIDFDEKLQLRDFWKLPGIEDNHELAAEFFDFRPVLQFALEFFKSKFPDAASSFLQKHEIGSATSLEAFRSFLLVNRELIALCDKAQS